MKKLLFAATLAASALLMSVGPAFAEGSTGWCC